MKATEFGSPHGTIPRFVPDNVRWQDSTTNRLGDRRWFDRTAHHERHAAIVTACVIEGTGRLAIR